MRAATLPPSRGRVSVTALSSVATRAASFVRAVNGMQVRRAATCAWWPQTTRHAVACQQHGTTLGRFCHEDGTTRLPVMGPPGLFKRLKAARLDNSLEAEKRRLAHVQVLIIDDFSLQALDATETADFYEICVERHQQTSTIITSNREPNEWLTMMADPLLAQSAVDRLASTAHELVIEGESYRQRQRPTRHTR
jgi:hypothetical protein